MAIKLEYDGKLRSVAEISRLAKFPYHVLYARVCRGVPIEAALSRYPNVRRHSRSPYRAKPELRPDQLWWLAPLIPKEEG